LFLMPERLMCLAKLRDALYRGVSDLR
jgi:hypothetical protein